MSVAIAIIPTMIEVVPTRSRGVIFSSKKATANPVEMSGAIAIIGVARATPR